MEKKKGEGSKGELEEKKYVKKREKLMQKIIIKQR
jgi:hypothetical protein